MNAAKVMVRNAFARAAMAYDAAADVQRAIGQTLLAQLPAQTRSGDVIDVGCGTGHGAQLLREQWPGARVFAIDFALDMTRRLPRDLRRICGDAEALPLAGSCIDFYWSNLTLQWCDPRRFAAEAARVLRPGGRVAVSTLGPRTFAELRAAFDGVDAYRHTIEFRHAEEIETAFVAAGFKLTSVSRQTIVRHYPDVAELLRAVRQLGANRVTGGNRRAGLMGKSAWRRFIANYESLRQPAGLPLGYDTLLLYAENP